MRTNKSLTARLSADCITNIKSVQLKPDDIIQMADVSPSLNPFTVVDFKTFLTFKFHLLQSIIWVVAIKTIVTERRKRVTHRRNSRDPWQVQNCLKSFFMRFRYKDSDKG
ncbi:hypothetical protein BpHYR1_019608 [Brachionus plicatilis]|uniref:Uncharacterized protein n=1 Tax=Brachionus plicatilis TaxID=10195 RepID=A0A3M7Q5A7_BRAPC|nr:hypothetical protein BpHYR1_019608 [Brachionus plicatilis]